MYNFKIENNRSQATIKSLKDMYSYACKLSTISISDSKASIWSGVNFDNKEANLIVNFVNNEDIEDVEEKLEEIGFSTKERAKLLNKTVCRKHKNIIKNITFDLNDEMMEDHIKIGKLEMMEKTLKTMQSLVGDKFVKPVKVIISDNLEGNLDGFYQDNTAYISNKAQLPVTLSHELSHGLCEQITPKHFAENSIFWSSLLEVSPNVNDIDEDIDLDERRKIYKKRKEIGDKWREKFLLKVDENSPLCNEELEMKYYNQSENTRCLFDKLQSHPYHNADCLLEDDKIEMLDKKEWFARAMEEVCKEDFEAINGGFQFGKTTLSRNPNGKDAKAELNKIGKVLRLCDDIKSGKRADGLNVPLIEYQCDLDFETQEETEKYLRERFFEVREELSQEDFKTEQNIGLNKSIASQLRIVLKNIHLTNKNLKV